MLQFRLSHRPVQLFSSSSSSLITLSYNRGIRTAATPKRLRDRVNSSGIAVSQFALRHKDTGRRVKVNRLLFGIDKYLGKGEWGNAWEFLYRRMDLPAMGDSKTRFDAYEHAATLFSSYERFREAREIQATMIDEGFIPSLSLRTRMASIAVLTKGAGEEDLLQLLQKPLVDSDFTELALYQLIRFLGDTMSFSPSAINGIVQTWTEHHGQISERKTLSYLIRICAKRGQLEDAKAWLRHSTDHGATFGAASFTDLMTGFVRREHTDELTATIANMQKANVAPDLAVFNTIISGHIKRLHFKDAVAAYNLLFSSRGKQLTPDKYTFMNMFNMGLRALEPRYQVYSVKKAQLPHPRKLHNNLIECHLIRTGGWPSHQSRTITTNVLNTALKLFMQTQDYEAAYILFRTFDRCQVPANSVTVSTVMRPLLAKIWRERRKASKNDTWLRTLLGSGWYEDVEANGTLFSLSGTDILERLWIVGSVVPQVDLDPRYLTFHANVEGRKVMTGSTNRLYLSDLKVLRRIVKRLFFAGAHRMDLDPTITTEAIWKTGVIQATRDMVPDIEAMEEYFASGRAGERLMKLSEGGGDKRIRHDFRYLGGG